MLERVSLQPPPMLGVVRPVTVVLEDDIDLGECGAVVDGVEGSAGEEVWVADAALW